MPFDSEGNFTRLHNWEDDRLNGIEIVTDHADEEDDNFAEGLSKTLVRDGRAPMTGDLNLGGFRIKNVTAAVSETDAVNKKQLDEVTGDFATRSGDQTFTGTNVFEKAVFGPTPGAGDSSRAYATTEFVQYTANQVIQNNLSNMIKSSMPNYDAGQAIQSGFVAPSNGVIVFDLPARMVGNIQVGGSMHSFNYNYNNTQNTVATFPVAKGQSTQFSGCTAMFFPCYGG